MKMFMEGGIEDLAKMSLEEIESSKHIKDDIDVRLKWLGLFRRRKHHLNVALDGVTFVGILSSCTHMGLVRDGFLHFQSMVGNYSIVPQIEHYGCMVDLLGRVIASVQLQTEA
ncbi:hypothetical protein VIGAN_02255700 [Vigna angularis var. angularis]|uniref:Uncharacterized protein n=1 Tax=Vigna angularis var. angularis TaxID=157739 RepID=A0A0S3RGE9_PHAAN|nr:hypothetical protein VIGAN_02255700 [Vigna angularis var. angularis]